MASWLSTVIILSLQKCNMIIVSKEKVIVVYLPTVNSEKTQAILFYSTINRAWLIVAFCWTVKIRLSFPWVVYRTVFFISDCVLFIVFSSSSVVAKVELLVIIENPLFYVLKTRISCMLYSKVQACANAKIITLRYEDFPNDLLIRKLLRNL